MSKIKLSQKDTEDAIADSADQNTKLSALFDEADPASDADEKQSKDVDLKSLFDKDRQRIKRRKRTIRNNVVYLDKNGKLLRTEAEEKAREALTIFIDNVPNQVKKEELVSFIRKTVGTKDVIVRIRAQSFEHGKGRGLFKLHKLNVIKSKLSEEGSCAAYCVLPTKEMFEKALKLLDNALFLDRHIRAEPAFGGASPFESASSVFLGNLLLEITEEDIRGFLLGHNISDVQKVRLIRDPVTRKGKGFGFVSFNSQDSVWSVLKLQGQYLQGRELRVKQVRDRTAEKDSKIRHNRSLHAPVSYNDMQKAKKQTPHHKSARTKTTETPEDESARDWEGKHAKKKLSKELTGLTKQWKATSDATAASAASKAKKKVEKEKRDSRKNK